MTPETILQSRKARIEQRLQECGIKDLKISFLRYLEFDEQEFATPYEAGCRIIILYIIFCSINVPEKKPAIVEWFKRENIWPHLSELEITYFTGTLEKEQLIDLSWQIEDAYILAWALNIIAEKPAAGKAATSEELDDFLDKVPSLGDELGGFLNSLSYRNAEDIFEENIFYELTTTYFRDLLFSGKKDKTKIDRTVAFERHKALNWLRRFSGITAWAETDTST